MENGSTECEKWKKLKPRKGDIGTNALLERQKRQVYDRRTRNYILLSNRPNF
ncbi:hypothetical protein Hanom_Chr07g00592471 [Helianthus anomalus]